MLYSTRRWVGAERAAEAAGIGTPGRPPQTSMPVFGGAEGRPAAFAGSEGKPAAAGSGVATTGGAGGGAAGGGGRCAGRDGGAEMRGERLAHVPGPRADDIVPRAQDLVVRRQDGDVLEPAERQVGIHLPQRAEDG